MVIAVRAFAAAAVAGAHDYAAMLSWRSWIFGWYVRVVAQVMFFALIGLLLGSQAQTHYLLIGNAMLVAATTSFFAIGGATIDVRSGTFPLVLASPTTPLVVFAGRSLYVIGDALLTSLGAFVLVGPIFGLPLPGLRTLLVVVPVLAAALSSYALSMFLAALVLPRVALRNLVSNLVLATMALLCGVNVPVTYLPPPAEWLAEILPLTHGVAAARGMLGGASSADFAVAVARELGAGALWLALAAVAFARFARTVRRTGAADFA
jgi:ABC-2 type transport system permease protein